MFFAKNEQSEYAEYQSSSTGTCRGPEDDASYKAGYEAGYEAGKEAILQALRDLSKDFTLEPK